MKHLNILKSIADHYNHDPVKHCLIYKHKGCSHVDGLLCDFVNCKERLDYEQKIADDTLETCFNELETDE